MLLLLPRSFCFVFVRMFDKINNNNQFFKYNVKKAKPKYSILHIHKLHHQSSIVKTTAANWFKPFNFIYSLLHNCFSFLKLCSLRKKKLLLFFRFSLLYFSKCFVFSRVQWFERSITACARKLHGASADDIDVKIRDWR